jgi:hypothetical protein
MKHALLALTLLVAALDLHAQSRPARPPRIGAGQIAAGQARAPYVDPRAAAQRGDVRPPRSPYRPGEGAAPIDIQVEVTRMQGLGCPAGGAVATVSPDGSSVSILFDKMSTELAAGSPSTEKKQCMVVLGLRFAGQYRVAIVGSDARGFVSVPAGGQSTIRVQHSSIFSADPRILQRMNLTQTFVGPRAEDVILHSDFHDVPLWSYCGSQMRGRQTMPLMTIGLEINSMNSNPSENLIAAIDSLDIGGSSTLTYQLLWTQDTRNCPR